MSLNGFHDVGHNLEGLFGSEGLVVEAREVVVVARPHQVQGLVHCGQRGQALPEICKFTVSS